MPDLWMDVDTALTGVPVNIMPLLDDTDYKTRETAVAYNAAGMDLVWNFVTTGGAFTQTAVTPTTAGDYDWTNQGDGMYTIEIPASGGASINNDTEGFGWFTGIATGVLPWRGPMIGFRAAGINNALIDSAWSATRGLAGTALPDAAADAAGGLPISDAGGLDLDAQIGTDIDAILADTNELQTDDVPGLIAALPTAAENRTEMDSNSTQLAAIVADTNELQADWVNGGRLDLILDELTAQGDTNEGKIDTVDSNVDAILIDTGTDIPARFDGIEGATFDTATDSLEAIRDRGDVAWITGGGGSITDILNVQPLVPPVIDLANTSAWRLGLMLFNALDDLPTTAEITPGTISIDRKAAGGTSWSAVVTDAAMSELAGLIYYDEVFDSGTGYAEGDSLRVTFKSQKITVVTNDYEISDSNGRIFYTYIRSAAGSGDWTSTEKEHMRYRLQIDGTQTAPSADAPDQMPVDTQAIDGSTTAALQQKRLLETAVFGTVSTGSTTTVITTTGLAGSYANDRINGRTLYFLSGSSLASEAAAVEDYDDTTGQITVAGLTAAPTNGDTFVII